MTGELIDATEAERLHLLDRVVAPSILDKTISELAETLRSRSLVTQLAAKEMVDCLAFADEIPQLSIDKWEASARESDDLSEGLAAFTERRAPDFHWRP